MNQNKLFIMMIAAIVFVSGATLWMGDNWTVEGKEVVIIETHIWRDIK